MFAKFFVLFLLIGALHLAAQAPIKVTKVDFDSTKDDWIQMEVELDFDHNTLPDARDQDFFENIGVQVYLAYEIDAAKRSYDYYSAEVTIAIAEAKEKYNVYFYLPGMIVERDQIAQAKPAYYSVALKLGSKEVPSPLMSPALSHRIKSSQIRNSFLAKAKEMSVRTKGLLMPSYYTPADYKSRVHKQPLYLRLDPDPAG